MMCVKGENAGLVFPDIMFTQVSNVFCKEEKLLRFEGKTINQKTQIDDSTKSIPQGLD